MRAPDEVAGMRDLLSGNDGKRSVSSAFGFSAKQAKKEEEKEEAKRRLNEDCDEKTVRKMCESVPKRTRKARRSEDSTTSWVGRRILKSSRGENKKRREALDRFSMQPHLKVLFRVEKTPSSTGGPHRGGDEENDEEEGGGGGGPQPPEENSLEMKRRRAESRRRAGRALESNTEYRNIVIKDETIFESVLRTLKQQESLMPASCHMKLPGSSDLWRCGFLPVTSSS